MTSDVGTRSAQLPGPYVGPQPLSVGNSIYGRDSELNILVQSLISERVVLLISPSGAGKTSLINAGLIPELQSQGFNVLGSFRVGGSPLLPGARGGVFVGNLLQQWNNRLPRSIRFRKKDLQALSLTDFVEPLVSIDKVNIPVIIFDQFEEALTAGGRDRDAQKPLFKELGQMLADKRIWALFAMREDYLGELEPFSGLFNTGLRARQRIDFLSQAAAIQAIVKPVEKFTQGAVSFNIDAAALLVDRLRQISSASPETTYGRYVEPVFLQVVCSDIWANNFQRLTAAGMRGQITKEDIPTDEKISDALSNFYDRVVVDVVGPQANRFREAKIRYWFEEELTNGLVRRQTLTGPFKSAEDIEVLDQLVSEYIIRPDVRNDATWYELSHDRLLVPIRNSNSKWRLSSPKGLLLRSRSQAWANADPNNREEHLLRGVELLQIEEAYGGDFSTLPDVERRFIESSFGSRKQRRRERYLTYVSWACIVGALVSIGFALTVMSRARDLKRTSELAANNRLAIAELQARQTAQDANRRVQLAQHQIEEERIRILSGANLAVQRAQSLAVEIGQRAEANQTRLRIEGEHDRLQAKVELDKRGEELASAGVELKRGKSELRRQEQVNNVRTTAARAEQTMNDPTFSPSKLRALGRELLDQEENLIREGNADGNGVNTYGLRVLQRILLASLNAQAARDHAPGTAVGYDAVQHSVTSSLSDGSFVVRSLSIGDNVTITACSRFVEPFGPDIGKLQGADCYDSSGSGSAIKSRELRGATLSNNKGEAIDRFWASSTSTVAPAANRVSLGYFTGLVESFTLPSGDAVPALRFKKTVRSISFNQNGSRIAASTFDSVFRVYDSEAAKTVFKGPGIWLRLNLALFGHRMESASSFAFGKRNADILAAGHNDGRVELWDIAKKRRILRLCDDSPSLISSITFSDDDKLVLATAKDGSVLVWGLPSKYGNVRDRFLYAVTDTSALCNEGATSKRMFANTFGTPTSGGFSPSGSLIAIGHQDGPVTIWRVSDSQHLLTLPGHLGGTAAVYFLSDSLLATVGSDAITRLWTIPTPQIIDTIGKLESSLQQWAESPLEIQNVEKPEDLLNLLAVARTVLDPTNAGKGGSVKP